MVGAGELVFSGDYWFGTTRKSWWWVGGLGGRPHDTCLMPLNCNGENGELMPILPQFKEAAVARPTDWLCRQGQPSAAEF